MKTFDEIVAEVGSECSTLEEQVESYENEVEGRKAYVQEIYFEYTRRLLNVAIENIEAQLDYAGATKSLALDVVRDAMECFLEATKDEV